MGLSLLRLVAQADDLSLCAAWDAPGHPRLGAELSLLTGEPLPGLRLEVMPARIEAPCVVDFSLPEGTRRLLDVLDTSPVPLVCGTTGLDAGLGERLHALSRRVPVVAAPNFSTGVTVLFELVRRAAGLLRGQIEAEVSEIHHRHKKDSPSGTAARLVEILARELSVGPDGIVHGREGNVGARPFAEIGVHALRGGEVIGEHTVHLFGPGERLELTHRAASREAFASGALVAARWVQGRAPGLYTMTDVLGL